VLPCLEMAVLDMKRGERSRLYAPAAWAFGAPNFPPAEAIDPRLRACDVEIEVELVSFDRAPDTNGKPMEEQCAVHARRKDAGNLLFSKGALHEAVAKWELADKTLPHGNSLRYDLSRGPRPADEVETMFAASQKIQLSTQLNLASTLLKLDEPERALEYANKALEKDEHSVKALFRRAQASMRIPPVDVEAVRADLLAAARLDPKSREIRAELDKLKDVHAAQKAEERGMFGGIFAKAEEKERAAWAPPPPKPSFGTEVSWGTAFGSKQR
jgi:FK506-binding protein 4/5